MQTIGYILSTEYTKRSDTVGDHLHGVSAIGKISAITRMVLTLQDAGLEQIVLVRYAKDKELEREITHLGVRLLTTESSKEEELLAAALRFSKEKNRGALLVWEHTPLFQQATVVALLEQKEPALPMYQGQKGLPIYLPEREVRSLLTSELPLLQGLAQELAQGCALETADKGTIVATTTHPLYRQAVAEHSLSARLRPELRVRIGREKPFLGPGSSQLLTLIASTGSVRRACQQMGISYSKGWKMITLMEEQLKAPVVERQQGGKRGGHANLTPLGERYLRQYIAFEKACQTAVATLFHEYFDEQPCD